MEQQQKEVNERLTMTLKFFLIIFKKKIIKIKSFSSSKNMKITQRQQSNRKVDRKNKKVMIARGGRKD
jgi:hypothetical protein